MKHATHEVVGTSSIVRRIKDEHGKLLNFEPLSLEKLLAPESFSFAEFCKGFTPHPEAEKLKKEAEYFGQKYGTWLENSKHYVNCAWYLYPSAQFERVLTVANNLSIGFYLNDVMGRDVFYALSHEEQVASRKMVDNMALLDNALITLPNSHPLEHANAEVLKEFKLNSPKGWFNKFLQLYCYHLNITHRDRNVGSLGYIPDVYDYMDNRCHYAAVHHLVMWIEYSSGQFLEWDLIMRTNFYQKLQRLHWVVAAFPALANDLFSFENEVIDNECDSNLVMVLVLNNPKISLSEAINSASGIIRNIVFEILSLLDHIEHEVENIRFIYPELASKLDIHLKGVIQFAQASWLWQQYTKRYKRTQSIWKETLLMPNAVSNQG